MSNVKEYRLDASHLNELQRETIKVIIDRCKRAHFTNVQVRVNGKWETFEADWIKQLEEVI